MTDAIHSIVASAARHARVRCLHVHQAQRRPVHARRPTSSSPRRAPGGAFTFTTGAGGFLQEFLYGYSGWRWRADRVHLDPSLPPQLTGVTLSAVHWQGRTVRVEIRRDSTVVTLLAGEPLTLESPRGAPPSPPARR